MVIESQIYTFFSYALVHVCTYARVLLFCTKDFVRKNKLFLQNKANFQKVKYDVNRVLTKDYDRMDTWSIRKTKPIQSQLKPIQSQLKPIKCQNKAKTNPIYLQQKVQKGSPMSVCCPRFLLLCPRNRRKSSFTVPSECPDVAYLQARQ